MSEYEKQNSPKSRVFLVHSAKNQFAMRKNDRLFLHCVKNQFAKRKNRQCTLGWCSALLFGVMWSLKSRLFEILNTKAKTVKADSDFEKKRKLAAYATHRGFGAVLKTMNELTI